MKRRLLILFLTLVVFLGFSPEYVMADDYIYFEDFVHHASGELCEHTPPSVSFTAFLDTVRSRILTENAPKWSEGDPNIDGHGKFGVEFGNFTNPDVVVGDSAYVHFYCFERKEQGILVDVINMIPLIVRFPLHLYLSGEDYVESPQQLRMNIDESNYKQITWKQVEGLTYSVYRRSFSDTLDDGHSRGMYTLIADSIIGSSYTDTTVLAEELYGYIVYAVDDKGNYSAHSNEVLEPGGVDILSVAPGATTVDLSWEPFQPIIGEVLGYNIYRKKVNEEEWKLIDYTGKVQTYSDSRLELGTNYEYKVSARLKEYLEYGESSPVSVMTKSSQDGYTTYANLKIGVIIYQNTNRGTISSGELEEIYNGLEVARLFYWRNSSLKMNVSFEYLYWTEYRDWGEQEGLFIGETAQDLRELGVMSTQYDIIFRIACIPTGFWSIGTSNLGLPGPDREVGFSQTTWPIHVGVYYPGDPDFNYGLTWIFTHECQHAIDDLYYDNGNPEMYHGDHPEVFPVACGEHYDFQAKMFRHFTSYMNLLPNWGDIYEAVDADGDDFPDDDPRVPLDEARFGSSPESIDTDGDGYSDKEEAIDGNYSGSDPLDPDTDNDGIIDGEDRFPRYPISRSIGKFTPKIDGAIEEGWYLVNDTVSFSTTAYSPELYMSYDDDYLYLAIDMQNVGEPVISFDFHGDGWWFSSGNTQITTGLNAENYNIVTWDADPAVQSFCGCSGMWDSDPAYIIEYGDKVVPRSDINFKMFREYPLVRLEMSIARNEYAGLTLQPGDSLGINIKYRRVNNSMDHWATTFDQYSFVNVILAGEQSVESEIMPETYTLEQNYPNPFNSETSIRYTITKEEFIKIDVFNILGQNIRTLVNGNKQPGVYMTEWDGKNKYEQTVPSGVYFYQMKISNEKILRRKMLLLK